MRKRHAEGRQEKKGERGGLNHCGERGGLNHCGEVRIRDLESRGEIQERISSGVFRIENEALCRQAKA